MSAVRAPVAQLPLSDLDGAELLYAAPAAGGHVAIWNIEAFALVSACAAGGQTMWRGGHRGGTGHGWLR